MITFWGICIVVFLIIEGVTVGLTSIWFALGALASLIAAILDVPIWLQVFFFIAVSLVSLLLTRPLAKKFINTKVHPTNADRCIGQECAVTETIDNLSATGTVTLDGKVWSARSATGVPISSGSRVRVVRIEGVKLIVAPAVDTAARSSIQ